MIFEPRIKWVMHHCKCGKFHRLKPQYEWVFSYEPDKPIKSEHTCDCGRQFTQCGGNITEVPADEPAICAT